MKTIVSLIAAGLLMTAGAAFAQNGQLNGTPPSAHNSGAGIQGAPGNKNGPPATPGTVGSSSTTERQNPAVSEQDSAKVKGLPGNKSGPAVKPPQ